MWVPSTWGVWSAPPLYPMRGEVRGTLRACCWYACAICREVEGEVVEVPEVIGVLLRLYRWGWREGTPVGVLM